MPTPSTSTAPMDEYSTTLPTEPGLYLFFGVRDDGKIQHMFHHKPTVELVRVGRNDQGLHYIGRDFFYSPSKAVGAWLPLDTGGLVAVATRILHEHYVQEQWAAYQKDWRFKHAGDDHRESFKRYLFDELHPSWSPGSPQPNSDPASDPLVGQLVEIANELGLLG